jgi:hypothetical protein
LFAPWAILLFVLLLRIEARNVALFMHLTLAAKAELRDKGELRKFQLLEQRLKNIAES